MTDMLNDIGNVSLLIIDPASAYLGRVDSHKNAEVRALMSHISELAESNDVAVILISHLNKSTSSPDALSRISGSGAFAAVARSAYLVAKDPADDQKRLFLPAKNNLGTDLGGLSFTVEGCLTPSGIGTSRIVWGGQTNTITADEALAGNDNQRTEREEAREWLKTELAGGVVKASDIKKSAASAGLAWHAVTRARTDLGIKSVRRQFDGGWEWVPPWTKNA